MPFNNPKDRGRGGTNIPAIIKLLSTKPAPGQPRIDPDLCKKVDL